MQASYEEELRARYPAKPGERIFEDEVYFKPEKPQIRKRLPTYMLKDEKKKNYSNEHPCQFKLLQPKAILGTPIKQREPQDIIKPTLRRRNAVLLLNDIHYGRLLKKMSKPQQPTEMTEDSGKMPPVRREMIYSFNL